MWIKLDDGIATHPKLLDAGILALGIQIRALCYASKNKTDGFLSVNAVPLLLTGLEDIGLLSGMSGQDADEFDWASYMVEHRLWDAVENGYYIHDYLDWNISKKEYEKLSKKLSSNGRKGANLRWNKEKSRIAKAIAPAIADPIAPLSTSTSTSSSLHSSPNSSPDQSNPQTKKILKNGHGKRAIHDDDKPTEKHFVLGKSLGVDVGPEWGKFKNYCLAHDKRYANFEAAFRNWIANAAELKGARHGLR